MEKKSQEINYNEIQNNESNEYFQNLRNDNSISHIIPIIIIILILI